MATLETNFLGSERTPDLSKVLPSGQKVNRIDPKIAMETIRFLPTSPNTGLLSPSYPKTPLRSSKISEPTPVKTPILFDIPKTVKAQSAKISSPIPDRPEPPTSSLNYGVVTGETEIPAAVEEKFLEAKRRADYRVKFSILREAYPQMAIPEPEDQKSLDEIEVMYRQYIKRIHIDSSVDQNQVYLLILWMVMEIIGGRFLRLPIRGYTKNQFNYMNKYRMLLIELGERSYAAGIGEGWPVELRILMMAAMNAVIFVLVHFLASKIGAEGSGTDKMAEELKEMITSFLTQNKGSDVLKRAEEATADNPPPPVPAQEASAPLGGLGGIGGMLANLASMFAGGGAAPSAPAAPAAPAQLKKPTTFGARRPRVAETQETS